MINLRNQIKSLDIEANKTYAELLASYDKIHQLNIKPPYDRENDLIKNTDKLSTRLDKIETEIDSLKIQYDRKFKEEYINETQTLLKKYNGNRYRVVYKDKEDKYFKHRKEINFEENVVQVFQLFSNSNKYLPFEKNVFHYVKHIDDGKGFYIYFYDKQTAKLLEKALYNNDRKLLYREVFRKDITYIYYAELDKKIVIYLSKNTSIEINNRNSKVTTIIRPNSIMKNWYKVDNLCKEEKELIKSKLNINAKDKHFQKLNIKEIFDL